MGAISRTDPLYIVMNAASGRGDAAARRAAITGVLTAAGQRHELVVVEHGSRLPAAAKRAADLARDRGGALVGAGGDGTLCCVAQEALVRGLRFGALPLGTFNIFGRSHGIPEDAEAATRALLEARIRPVPVGLVNGKVFLVNASVGLYPRVIEDREASRRRHGRSRLLALAVGVTTLVRSRRVLWLELEAEGQTRRLRASTLVMVGNSLQLERLGIPGAAALEEGSLVAIAVRPAPALQTLGLLARGLFGRLGDAELVDTFCARGLVLRRPGRRRRIKVARDGEVARMTLPLEVMVAPRPLQLLVPP